IRDRRRRAARPPRRGVRAVRPRRHTRGLPPAARAPPRHRAAAARPGGGGLAVRARRRRRPRHPAAARRPRPRGPVPARRAGPARRGGRPRTVRRHAAARRTPGGAPLNALDVALWVVAPYIALTSFVLGHIWRYRYDKFGWTTRSSQLYESRLLRIGSPLFHFGILIVLLGHVVGLV